MVLKSLDKALVQTLTLYVFVLFWKTERIFDRVSGYNYSALFIILCAYVKFQICSILSIRYMTWDSHKFPNPEEMQKKLAAKGRRVCIKNIHLIN